MRALSFHVGMLCTPETGKVYLLEGNVFQDIPEVCHRRKDGPNPSEYRRALLCLFIRSFIPSSKKYLLNIYPVAGILQGPRYMNLNGAQNYSHRHRKTEIIMQVAKCYYKDALRSTLGILRKEELTPLEEFRKAFACGGAIVRERLCRGLRV